jgi:hypothetical protein
MFFLCWTLGFKKIVFCPHLLVMSKRKPLLKNMTKNLCFLFFLSVIIICIFWLNLKGVLVGIGIEEDKSLDIFQMTTNTSEPTIEFINRELLIFKYYQVDVKNIECPLQ